MQNQLGILMQDQLGFLMQNQLRKAGVVGRIVDPEGEQMLTGAQAIEMQMEAFLG
jgi:hypothetical protein